MKLIIARDSWDSVSRSLHRSQEACKRRYYMLARKTGHKRHSPGGGTASIDALHTLETMV